MLRPSQESFEELAKRGNWVPVVREILADMDTPLSLFRRLDDGHTSFLFESVEGGEKWGRFSFIGTGARALFRAHGADVEWEENGRVERMRAPGDPLEILRAKPRHGDGVRGVGELVCQNEVGAHWAPTIASECRCRAASGRS